MILIQGYQINEKIYESTNTLVYHANRETDNKSVILKILKPDYPTQMELSRYRREYEIICSLDLECVVKAYSLERYQSGLLICMEDFGGIVLKDWLTNYTLTMPEFIKMAIDIASAIGQIHSKNIIHKDINSANMVINPQTRQLKLIDFGIATTMETHDMSIPHYSTHVLEGTLAYISPEQTGRTNRPVDYRTDFYSLGVMLYEILTGRLPHENTDTMELVHAHIARTPVSPQEFGTQPAPLTPLQDGGGNTRIAPILAWDGVGTQTSILSDIIMKLMAKNPEERYQSVHGLKWDLEQCLHPPLAPPPEGEWNLCRSSEGEVRTGFELGQKDFPQQFQISQNLHGRRENFVQLTDIFEHVCAGHVALVMVTSKAGMGKIVLVNEIHRPVAAKQGYFIQGQFDESEQHVPYAAFSQAFNELCNYLLVEDETTLHKWQTQVQEGLGKDGQMLSDSIPNLTMLIGEQPPITQLGNQETQNRLHMIFQNFIRTLSNKEHPLVIFLNNLQWADEASIELIEFIISSSQTKYIMLIGSYHDEYVDVNHPLIKMITNLKKSHDNIHSIHLEPLNITHITNLVADTLYAEHAKVTSLAKLLLYKTGGNPFFINQFLTKLYSEGYFTRNKNTWEWTWDMAQIESVRITDNMAESMTQQLQNLPDMTKDILQVAACIGDYFDLGTLESVIKKIEFFQAKSATIDWMFVVSNLMPAIEQGLVVLKMGDSASPAGTYQFSHGWVRDVSYSSMPNEIRSRTHWQIGQLFLEDNGDDAKLFDIVDQLNNGKACIADIAEKRKLAQLNLTVGEKAKENMSYQSAKKYLATGIDLLGQEHWQTDYRLMFKLNQAQGECAFLIGDFEKSDQLLNNAMNKATSQLDKADICVTKIIQLSGQGKHHQAVVVMVEALNMLGLDVPMLTEKETYMKLTMAEIELYQANMQEQTIDDLWNLPLMKNEEMKAILRIVGVAFDSIAVSTPQLLPFFASKATNLSIEYGNVPYSTLAHALLAVIAVQMWKDLKHAYDLAYLGFRLNQEKLPSPDIITKVSYLYSIYSFLQYHITDSIERFNNTFQIGVDVGDSVYADYAISTKARYTLRLNLDEGLHATEKAIAYFKQINSRFSWLRNDMFKGFIKCLKGETISTVSFDYDDFREEDFVDSVQETSLVFFSIYKQYKLEALCLFEHFDEALLLVHEREKWIQIYGGFDFLFRMNYYLYSGITVGQASMPPESSNLGLTVKASLDHHESMAILDECIAELKLLAEQCPMNFLPAYLILVGEKARLENRIIEAFDSYDEAIKSAKEHGYYSLEAIASELAAKLYMARGKDEIAYLYLTKAHYGYEMWGASAKIMDLEKKYPQLYVRTIAGNSNTRTLTSVDSTMTSRMTSHNMSRLDLASFVKASQAISSEIELENLLAKMIKIVAENAGAERVLLLLRGTPPPAPPLRGEGSKKPLRGEGHLRGEEWLIEAECIVAIGNPIVLQSMPIIGKNGDSLLPTSIVNYVANTKKHIVLQDATASKRFAKDKYIQTKALKSALCLPLLNHGILTGILYFENNLVRGAFTPDRLEILNLLSTDIAISIDQAKMLSERQEMITNLESADRAKSEFLTAISHELRTPLNSILGFADLILLGVSGEINEQVHQDVQLIYNSGQHLLAIINDILDISKIEAGMIELVIEPLDIWEVVNEVLLASSVMVTNKAIDIEVDMVDNIPEMHADRTRLKQTLLNLVENAIEFTEKGKVIIVVRMSDTELDMVHFSIKDTGIGIPLEKQTAIFEQFQQADMSNVRKHGGIGLGLSICQQLVLMHGGTIGVHSKIGIGSEFWFTIPVGS